MSNYAMATDLPGFEDDVITREDTQVQEPRLYKVLLHNDDYTPQDFVVMILETIFHKPHQVAVEIMLDVHRKGLGICGVFPFAIAETKVANVIATSRAQLFPLMCTLEPE